jgi:hypothetical protein
MDFFGNSEVGLPLPLRHEFSNLVPYRFDSCLFVLSSLPEVERPTASAKCFMFSILRVSELGYFLSYLRRASG